MLSSQSDESFVGSGVGDLLGADVGSFDGLGVVGTNVGACVGSLVGDDVGIGAMGSRHV